MKNTSHSRRYHISATSFACLRAPGQVPRAGADSAGIPDNTMKQRGKTAFPPAPPAGLLNGRSWQSENSGLLPRFQQGGDPAFPGKSILFQCFPCQPQNRKAEGFLSLRPRVSSWALKGRALCPSPENSLPHRHSGNGGSPFPCPAKFWRYPGKFLFIVERNTTQDKIQGSNASIPGYGFSSPDSWQCPPDYQKNYDDHFLFFCTALS